MHKLIVLTYVMRILGILLVLVYFFGGNILDNLFPGLDGMSLNPVFYAGIGFYFVGAVVYYVANAREKRRPRE